MSNSSDWGGAPRRFDIIAAIMKSSILTALLLTPFLLLDVEPRQQQPAQSQASSQPREPASESPSENISVEENLQYGVANGQKLSLDLYQPAGAPAHPRPGIVLIHGGGWTSFDKSTMRGMGRFLARSGFVAISVEYRLLHGNENRWPAQLDDVQRSVRWLRANATKYDVDPRHLGALGHSAGAQLAALLGMEDTRDNSDAALAMYSSRVQAVTDVSGPADFTTERNPQSDAFMTDFLGVAYAQHPDVWRDASPVFHVSKDCAPFLIVHGTNDESVPISQAQELYEKLNQAGIPVKFVKLDDGHTFGTLEARERLALETVAFFNRYLRASR